MFSSSACFFYCDFFPMLLYILLGFLLYVGLSIHMPLLLFLIIKNLEHVLIYEVLASHLTPTIALFVQGFHDFSCLVVFLNELYNKLPDFKGKIKLMLPYWNYDKFMNQHRDN